MFLHHFSFELPTDNCQLLTLSTIPLLLMSPFRSSQVCHAPDLLTLSPLRLSGRVGRLKRAMRAFGPWEERQMSPALRGDCLLATTTTLHRLKYLVMSSEGMR